MRNKTNKTIKKLAINNFKDDHDQDCILKKSSSSLEDKIWFGVTNPKLMVYENNSKGKCIVTDMPSTFSVNSKMHLTRSQVKELLPYLENFVNTGNLEK